MWVLLRIFVCEKSNYTNMKKIITLLLACIPLWSIAQDGTENQKNYLKGAVPVVNGAVVFEQSYTAQGKTKQQIYDSLLVFTQKLVAADDRKTQSRIMENDVDKGIIVANVEETLYFKKTKWVTDATRFYYHLIFECSDNKFKATMQRIRYIYEPERNFNNGNPINAEEWITDEHAFKKNGVELSRATGKFRRKTIDRKDELFKQAAQAVRGKKKVKRIVFEEEEE